MDTPPTYALRMIGIPPIPMHYFFCASSSAMCINSASNTPATHRLANADEIDPSTNGSRANSPSPSMPMKAWHCVSPAVRR